MLGIGLGVMKNMNVGSSPTLSFNFTSSLPTGTVFTRASPAWFFDGTNGHQFTEVASGSPVFDKRPYASGLRVEPARQQRMLQSRVTSDASWSVIRCTWGSSGYERGHQIQEVIVSSTSENTHLLLAPFFSVQSGQPYTTSMIMKNGENVDNGWIYMDMSVAGSARRVFFNILSGTIGNVHADHNATITDEGSGWYRCSITGTAVSSSNGANQIGFVNADNDHAYDGADNRNIWFMHAQCEIGENASSPIVSSNSNPTRAAETVINTVAVNSILLTEGVFVVGFASYHHSGYDGGNNGIFEVGNAGTDYLRATVNADSNAIGFHVASGNTVQASMSSPSEAFPYTKYNIGFGYEANSFVGVLGNNTPLTDTAGTVPSSVYTIQFGMAGGVALNGWLSSFKYYDNRLTNAAIQEVVT